MKDRVSRFEALNAILGGLAASSGDIEASAIVSADGLLMASNFPAGLDEDVVSAMAASLLVMGQRAVEELNRGELEQVFVRGSQGLFVIMAVGTEGVLTTVCSKKAKLGLVFLDMQRAAAEAAKII